ncbi:CHAT domain-containing protein [Streptacidiphilus fuscans]|uniref:CHAT domain-containing protein n=1 Tax=Streptacidiphilus fuscans TaxID=2789292 RepID=A0A931FJ87_9ACTN|nr:CHAT domain-containing protein [Streptacidiphilus fuscans]MBF9072514.1 CHAT domain-containing protein [Streptacidiphilus fuscans]
MALQNLYEETGDLHDLEQAVAAAGTAVAEIPVTHPARITFVGGYVNVLRKFYEQTDRDAALDEALAIGEQAARQLPAHQDPAFAGLLNNLALALRCDFERSGDIGVLRRSVDHARTAVAVAPADEPEWAEALQSLGTVLQILAEKTGDERVLREAITCGREAVAAAYSDSRRADALGDLGIALRMSFERSGDLDEIEGAVECGRQAVAASVGRRRYPTLLTNLSTALNALAERTGSLETLEEAVDTARKSVTHGSPVQTDHAVFLHNLHNALLSRYRRTGDLASLEEAVAAGREAVAATPPRHADLNRSKNNLALSLRAVYERTGQRTALAEATRLAREVVTGTAGQAGHGLHLFNLSGLLGEVHSEDGDLGTLQEAVSFARAASQATPPDHVDQARRLGMLGRLLLQLFKATGDLGSLEEAATALQAAVRGTPDDHPRRASNLYDLAGALRLQAEHGSSRDLFEQADACYREVAEQAATSTLNRIMAYRELSLLAVDTCRPAEALQGIEGAVDLLETLAPGTLQREDREFQLARLAGTISGDAAAAALLSGDPVRAIEILERSRGILTADTVGARGPDHLRLREHSPELARRLDHMRSVLDDLDGAQTAQRMGEVCPGRQRDYGIAQQVATERQQAHEQWLCLVAQARALPGFQNYLRPGIRELSQSIPDGGAVVFITTSSMRCDALIATGDPEQPAIVVPLDGLTQECAYEKANSLIDARLLAADNRRDPLDRIAAQQEILTILTWLWHAVGEPVLTRLGHTATPQDDQHWPRIWWCPVGGMARLPFHAAGDYSGATAAPAGISVLDRVVSSYTTTLRALGHPAGIPAAHRDPATVIVPVADVPGSPLRGVSREAQSLSAVLPTARVLASPSRDDVLDALPNHQIAHFACHGYANMARPSRSQLILTDHATAPLTVADISGLQLSAELAFLSACDTTVAPSRLADEAVHLTGAFQLAGFRQVIGTLWAVDDQVEADLAIDFYHRITNGGTTAPETARAPYALHNAVRSLRDQYPRSPMLWAAQIHVGT